MSAIATKIVGENKLSPEMNLDELAQYSPELLSLLTDKVKRDQARRRLQNRYNFSKEQASALVPFQKVGRSKGGAIPATTKEMEGGTVNLCHASELNDRDETIRDLAQRIVQENLGEMEVKEKAMSLIRTSPTAMAASSRLSRLHRELRNLNVTAKIIGATYDPESTRLANKMQKGRQKLRENEGINYPDHFSQESVKERLDAYDASIPPDLQALADVTVMLCIRPAEIKTLRISDGGVTGYAKNREQRDIPRVFRSMEKNEKRATELLTWIQDAISSGQLRDPGKPGVQWFNVFLKKYDLLPSSLRKIGSVFAVVEHGAKNLSNAMTIASEALRHNPNNSTSPAQNYTIVNYRRRGEPPEKAEPFKLFDGSCP